MNKNFPRILFFYFLSAIIVFSLFSPAIATDRGLKEYYEVRFYFGTQVSIHCFYNPEIDISRVAKQCWQKADQIQQDMNINAVPSDGNLAQLNLKGFQGVRVNDDIYQVLKQSLKYSQLTNGAYDVTILPLVEVWKNAARANRLPDQTELEEAKEKVGFKNLRFVDPDKILFLKKGMKVDLGSPASGYFCDQIAKILLTNRIQNFLVDGGGELFAQGLNEGQFPWRIGIQDPFHKEKIVAEIDIRNQGISTSGNYEKFYTIGNETFSHIINPLTGLPEKDTVSVTVIAETAQAANELSTGLCVLGGEKGLELIRKLKNVETLIVEKKNGKISTYATKKMRTKVGSLSQ